MRYSVYKHLNNLSNSIVEAVSYVKQNIESVNLLADCISAILAIKETFIKNNIELKEIDIFSEIIEKIVECIEKNIDYEEHIDSLLEIAKSINLYCQNDIKYKFKIVFFAELGAKWDAMDSVYWAYKERKDCDVEVIIAPIFRSVKYPNGEVKTDIVYEDFLTPMGISHTLFKDYDIKKDLPDITFTSQPYESVTPEDFWAENITPYTRLVYLPYFTSPGISKEEEIYVQSQMPIHKLAWKVICQSDIAKKAFMRYSNSKLDNFLPIGLPKWDWVKNIETKHIDFPRDWEKLKGKKLMLYNIHYSFPAQFDLFVKRFEKFLNKYNENKGLIFRFHPMTETMFKVYYPQYQEKWKEIIEIIDKSDNAVIDRNFSYEYAFKFSDFLYTTQSSLAYQYIITQKPIVLGDTTIFTPENTFIECSKMGRVTTVEDRDSLIDEIFNGIDMNKKDRLNAMNDAMPNLNVNIGKKVANLLIKEIEEENV